MADTALSAVPGSTVPASRRAPAVLPLWVAGGAFWAVVLLVVLARTTGVADSAAPGTFGIIFTSIVVEALPFIFLGAAASSAIAVFVPARAFTRLARLPDPCRCRPRRWPAWRCRCPSAGRFRSRGG